MLTLALLFLSTLGQDESLPCIAIALEAGAGSSDAPKILNLEPALSAPEVDAKNISLCGMADW